MYEVNKQCYITFYGEWIGRPCDNVYCLKSIEEKDGRIRIVLDDMEVSIDNPVNIQSAPDKYTIAHADKVTVNLNDNVFIIYEKTDKGLKRTENGQVDYVKQTDYAVCVNILRG